jgi:predicted DNA-binding protein YlxM (UPF0122 family)
MTKAESLTKVWSPIREVEDAFKKEPKLNELSPAKQRRKILNELKSKYRKEAKHWENIMTSNF